MNVEGRRGDRGEGEVRGEKRVLEMVAIFREGKRERVERGLHQRVAGIWSFSWLLWPEARWKRGEEVIRGGSLISILMNRRCYLIG